MQVLLGGRDVLVSHQVCDAYEVAGPAPLRPATMTEVIDADLAGAVRDWHIAAKPLGISALRGGEVRDDAFYCGEPGGRRGRSRVATGNPTNRA